MALRLEIVKPAAAMPRAVSFASHFVTENAALASHPRRVDGNTLGD
jgi:hypothetical protein